MRTESNLFPKNKWNDNSLPYFAYRSEWIRLDKKLKLALKEVRDNCPFILAEELGVKVENEYFELDSWCGAYMYNADRDKHYIFINTKMDNDIQESTCLLLVQQHLLHEGNELSINTDYLKNLNRIDREVVRCLKIIADTFLGGFTKVSNQKA